MGIINQVHNYLVLPVILCMPSLLSVARYYLISPCKKRMLASECRGQVYEMKGT